MLLVSASEAINPRAWQKAMRQALPDREVWRDGQSFDPTRVTYLLAWNVLAARLRDFSGLRVIFSLGAGVDHLHDAGRLPDIPVVRVVDAHLKTDMTTYILWRTLALLRSEVALREAQLRCAWEEPDTCLRPQDLCVGVLGYGVLGTAAADALRATGFEVVGWSRTAKNPAPRDRLYVGDQELGSFLDAVDILVVLLPLTSATRGLIDARFLDRLAKETPLGAPALINCARGEIHVESDVMAALDSGTLSHATLDVFSTEPLPPDNPLWRHPKVCVTPHAAGPTDRRSVTQSIARQIRAFESGEALTNLADPRLGY